MTWDWILYTIIALFVAWEAIAHFIVRNTTAHTLSNRILDLEHKHGLWVRILVAMAVTALGVHLEGAF